MQPYTLYLFLETALHVSGGISTHHQEHSQLYLQHLAQVPDAVYTVVCAHDDGWRYRPKHIEKFPELNKLCNIASCWIYISEYVKQSVKLYLYSFTVPSWQVTGRTLPFSWNLIGYTFFLSVLVLAWSHWQQWSCMTVAVCCGSVMTVIILVDSSLVLCCFLLGLHSVSYCFWYLDMRTWCINIIIAYLGYVVLIFEDHVFGMQSMLKKEWGISLSRDSVEGGLREGSFTGEPERWGLGAQKARL